MTKANFKTEAAMAAHIITWLRPQGWEIYQEVPFRASTADILATRGPLVWVIECKLRLNFDVIGQARSWVQYAHMASVAVPGGGSYNTHIVVGDVLSAFGLGMLEANDTSSYKTDEVTERVAPPYRRRVLPGLRESLCEEHKTYAVAGSPSGRSWTPWKRMCQDVLRAVQASPGIRMKDLVDTTRHSYQSNANARTSIARGIEAGYIEGVRIQREGRRLHLYPTVPASVKLPKKIRAQVLVGHEEQR